MPAGLTIMISSSRLSTPEPQQVAQGFSGTFLLPRQVLHVEDTENVPKGERRDSTTWPLPLQVGHVFVFVPGSAPLPVQCAHALSFVINTWRVTPKIDSLKESSTSIEMSRPLERPRGEPPKMSENPPKISPRSTSKSTPPPPN